LQHFLARATTGGQTTDLCRIERKESWETFKEAILVVMIAMTAGIPLANAEGSTGPTLFQFPVEIHNV
jgi:hypothetical protein